LEDGVLVDDDVGEHDGYIEEQDEPESKRRRLELESGDAQPEAPSLPPPNPGGLLSADTLEGLKYFAQIRSRQGLPPPQQRPPPSLPSKTGLGLADYGSDEDD